MWKNRNELPNLVKLNFKFDITKLKEDVKEYSKRDWDSAVKGPYENLRQAYGKNLTPDAYNGMTNEEVDKHRDWKKIPYKQLALTDYNPDYKIRKNRNSGKRWDSHFMKGDPKFDERTYSKLNDDLPPYLFSTIKSFGENVTRVGLALCEPGGGIDPHRDYDTTFSTRFHIAIETNKDATCNDIHIPADGYVWFLNSGLTHWVKNKGKEPRIHLLIMIDSQEIIEKREWLERYNN